VAHLVLPLTPMARPGRRDRDVPTARVTRVELSPLAPDEAHVTCSGFRTADAAADVLRTRTGDAAGRRAVRAADAAVARARAAPARAQQEPRHRHLRAGAGHGGPAVADERRDPLWPGGRAGGAARQGSDGPPTNQEVMPLTRRRFLTAAAGVGLLAATPLPAGAVTLGPRAVALGRGAADARSVAGTWLAGDFHCHTTASHDVWAPADGPTEEIYTAGHTAAQQIALAEARGLDFLAITDHGTLDGILHEGYRSDRLVLVPGYEASMGGHAGVFVPTIEAFPGGRVFDERGRALVARVREADGMTVVNHPFYDTGAEAKYALDEAAAFDAVEVWNSAWLTREELQPVYEPDNHLAVQWYGEQLAARAGRRPRAAIGGSDNHWVLLDALAGVGQPTTWVHAADRTPAAVIEAVRAGRTSVAFQPPALGGSRLDLEVREAWADGRTVGLGGDVREGGVHRVTATAGTTMVGQRLRIIAAGLVVLDQPVEQPDQAFAVDVALAAGESVRAEAYADTFLAVTALTSAVVARAVEPDEEDGPPPAPGPLPRPAGPSVSYDGFQSARAMDRRALGQVLATLGDRDLPRCSCAH
jgi:hypothetical protein